jgi:hypothetical protein
VIDVFDGTARVVLLATFCKVIECKIKTHGEYPVERFLTSADEKLVSARKILAFDEEALSSASQRSNAQGFPRLHV